VKPFLPMTRLQARRKGDLNKVKLALALRSQTTMPLAWIAQRLSMGTRGHLALLLGQAQAGKIPESNKQHLLNI
jgi:hypothetical protein